MRETRGRNAEKGQRSVRLCKILCPKAPTPEGKALLWSWGEGSSCTRGLALEGGHSRSLLWWPPLAKFVPQNRPWACFILAQ